MENSKTVKKAEMLIKGVNELLEDAQAELDGYGDSIEKKEDQEEFKKTMKESRLDEEVQNLVNLNVSSILKDLNI